MTVIVCGSRDPSYAQILFCIAELSRIHAKEPITHLIHGAAPGIDTVAGSWAASQGLRVTDVAAQWQREGKAAGPLRNARMLAMGPARVIAFPGGKGTANMVAQARAAGVRVSERSP